MSLTFCTLNANLFLMIRKTLTYDFFQNRTLQGMFPNLDQEVIIDVVRAQDGHVGRAVDACLALTTT